MKVCATLVSGQTCGHEMKCLKTGMYVKIHDHYVYSGDLFECPSCGSRVVVTASQGMDIGDDAMESINKSKFTIDLK